MARRRKPAPKTHIRKVNTKLRCTIPFPPIIYESAIFKGVNDVDQMTAFYGHFANNKFEDYIPYLNHRITQMRTKLTDCKHTERHLKLILKHMEPLTESLELEHLSPITLTAKEWNVLDYKVTAISHLDLDETERHCVTNKVLPVFSQCYQLCSGIEFFLLCLGQLAQGLVHLSGTEIDWQGYSFNFFRNRLEYTKHDGISEGLLRTAANLLRVVLVFMESVHNAIGDDRYTDSLQNSFCERRLAIQVYMDKGLIKVNRKLKAGLRNELSNLWLLQQSDAELLYGLAQQCCTQQHNNSVSITASDMAKLENLKEEKINRIAELKVAIEHNLEENKRRIILNTNFELFEREKLFNTAARDSAKYQLLLASLKRLGTEKTHWIAACKRKLERNKLSQGQSRKVMKDFRDSMLECIRIVPERFEKKMEPLIALYKEQIALKNRVAERKLTRVHLTNKIRQQWAEHNDFIVQSLADDAKIENSQYTRKFEILERVKRDCSEARSYFNRSFVIPSQYPKRLEPPFPDQLQQQRNHRASLAAAHAANASRVSSQRQNMPPHNSHNRSAPKDTPHRSERHAVPPTYEITVHQMEPSQRRDENRHKRPDKPKNEKPRCEHSGASKPVYRAVEMVRDRKRYDEPDRKDRDDSGKIRKRKVDEKTSSRSSSSKSSKKVVPVSLKKTRYSEEAGIDVNDPDSSNDSLPLVGLEFDHTESNIENVQQNDVEKPPPSSLYYTFMKEKRLMDVFGLKWNHFLNFLLPFRLMRPVNLFPSYIPVVSPDAPSVQLSDEENDNLMSKLKLFYTLKYMHHECAFQISVRAKQDFEEQVIFPYEIVGQIIHHQNKIAKLKAGYEQHSKHVPNKYKVKVTVAGGLLNVLTRCTDAIDKLQELENNELTRLRHQNTLYNGHDFNTEHLKLLRMYLVTLTNAEGAAGLSEKNHQSYLENVNRTKQSHIAKAAVIEKKKRALEAARQRLLQNNEAKEKRLDEIRQRYAKLGDSYKQSCINYSESEISFTKKKLAYNAINENLKRMDSACSRPDPITEAIHKKYKEMLVCPSCKVRQKDSAFTKCYHLFCEQCITDLFKSRNRKCPECNMKVGINEYKRVFI